MSLGALKCHLNINVIKAGNMAPEMAFFSFIQCKSIKSRENFARKVWTPQ